MAEEGNFVMHDIPASSRLAAWGYNDETQKARAVFPKTGRSCVYSDVPRDVFDAVLNAPSVGAAFGALIVGGGFPFEYED